MKKVTESGKIKNGGKIESMKKSESSSVLGLRMPKAVADADASMSGGD